MSLLWLDGATVNLISLHNDSSATCSGVIFSKKKNLMNTQSMASQHNTANEYMSKNRGQMKVEASII